MQPSQVSPVREPVVLPIPGPGRRPWLAPALVVAALVVAMPLFFVNRGQDGDFAGTYLPAASRMAALESVNRPHASYAYPPCMALLTVPLSDLPLNAALVAWSMVNVAALLGLLYCGWRLSADDASQSSEAPPLRKGRETGMRDPRRSSAWHIFGLAGVLSLRWIVAPLENQQFDVLIAGLVFWGCWRIANGRDLTGGLLIGAAAAMKCTPLLFAPYLLLRGRWLAAACVVAAAIGLNLLPDLVYPQSDGGSYVVDWQQQYLSAVGRLAPGFWHSELILNQSLGGLFNRFARMGLHSIQDVPSHEIPEHVARWLKWVTYGTGLLLLALTALLAGRLFRSHVPSDGARSAWAREMSAIVCLMLLLSPMSGKSHYVILWLPSLVIARRALERPSWGWTALVVFLLIAGTVTTKGLIGKGLGDFTLAWGLPTWFAIAQLAAMWRLFVESRRSEREVSTALVPIARAA